MDSRQTLNFMVTLKRRLGSNARVTVIIKLAISFIGGALSAILLYKMLGL